MPTMFVLSIVLQIGMFVERWMIVAPTLAMGMEPHQHDVMWGSVVQWAIVFGSFGWFGILFLVFVKIFPCVSMYEVKELVYHIKRESEAEEQAERSKNSKAGQAPDKGKPTGSPEMEGA